MEKFTGTLHPWGVQIGGKGVITTNVAPGDTLNLRYGPFVVQIKVIDPEQARQQLEDLAATHAMERPG